MPYISNKIDIEHPEYLSPHYDQTNILDHIRRITFYVPYSSFWLSFYQQIKDGFVALSETKADRIDIPTSYAIQTKRIQRLTRIAVAIAAMAAGAGIVAGLVAAGVLVISNPVGWAILGAAALVGLGYAAYKLTQWVQKTWNRRSTRITIAQTTSLTDERVAELAEKMGVSDKTDTLRTLFNGLKGSGVRILSDQQITTLCEETSLDLTPKQKKHLRHMLGFSQEQVTQYAATAGLDPNNLPALIKHSESSNLLADQHDAIHAKRTTYYMKGIIIGMISGAIVTASVLFAGLCILGIASLLGLAFSGVATPLGITLIFLIGAVLGGIVGYDVSRDASHHPQVNNARRIKGVDDENDPKRFKLFRLYRLACLTIMSFIPKIHLLIDYAIAGFTTARLMRIKPTPPYKLLGDQIRIKLYQKFLELEECEKNKVTQAEESVKTASKNDLNEREQQLAFQKYELDSLRTHRDLIFSVFSTNAYDRNIDSVAKTIFRTENRDGLRAKIQGRLFSANDSQQYRQLSSEKLDQIFADKIAETMQSEELHEKLIQTLIPQIQTDEVKASLNQAINHDSKILLDIATNEWPELKALRDAWKYCVQNDLDQTEFDKLWSFITYKHKDESKKFNLKNLSEADLPLIIAFWKEYYQKQKTKLDKTRVTDFMVHQLYFNIYFIFNEVFVKSGIKYLGHTFLGVFFEPARIMRNFPKGGTSKAMFIASHIVMVTLILLRLALLGVLALALGLAKTVIDGLILLPVISKIVSAFADTCRQLDTFVNHLNILFEVQLPWYAKLPLMFVAFIASPFLFLYNLSFIPNFISQYPKLFKDAKERNNKTSEDFGNTYSSFRLVVTYTLRYIYALLAPPILYLMSWLSVGKNSYSEQRAAYLSRKETARTNLEKIAAYEQAKAAEADGGKPPSVSSATIFGQIKGSLEEYTNRKNTKEELRTKAEAAPTPKSDKPDWYQCFFGKMNEKPEGSKPRFLPPAPYRSLLEAAPAPS